MMSSVAVSIDISVWSALVLSLHTLSSLFLVSGHSVSAGDEAGGAPEEQQEGLLLQTLHAPSGAQAQETAAATKEL